MSFKICVVGCGGMSTRGHGPSCAKYAATHPDTVLAACCDLDEAKAITYRDTFGFAKHYTDLVTMLDTERPDAVCLIAPVALTCELSCRIMEMGYPLIMEKPPGMTVEETDRMIAVAEAKDVSNQVALNRRHTPLIRELKRLLSEGFQPSEIQNIRYDFFRYNRKDADFSTTAIHGIDTVRFLAGSDYAHVRFHYQPFPELGDTVANIFMDCTMESGATAHLNFCPVAGLIIERATVNLLDHTFFLHIPMWRAFDDPGRLIHVEKKETVLDVTGEDITDGPEPFELSGFYGENASFFDDLRAGRRPVGDVKSARQSVEIAQCIRERKEEYHKSS
ncbi:MAG: Gfo/Idh/MocA family oxidoreductase [Planctomycetes bacterium]|nr:Gfo/Idh/MocA family oxidoreductase [Planctomycetota bacterium]